jgi:hypothetical protein
LLNVVIWIDVVMNKKVCPYEAWQLIQAREILQWLTGEKAMNLDKQSFLERIEDTLFNIAYDKLGLKPISKCTIEELQEELNKRLGNQS